MAKYLLSIGLLLGTSVENLFGQSIQTDRPDQTECPFIVPKKFIQLENGFLVENKIKSSQTLNHPSTLWKYGMSERFELRLITELISEKTDAETIVGLSPVTVGFKVNICTEKGLLPMTSFIGHLTTSHVATKEFHTSYFAPSFRFTMQHTLSDKFTLGYNLGAEWDGETAAPTYIDTLTTGVSITEKFGGYVELYGFVPQKEIADHRFDGGLTYLLTDNFMIDISGGVGLSKNAPKNYFAIGLSFRFNTAKK